MALTSDEQKKAYTGLRSDVIALIKERPCNVLDVGCSNGVLLDYLKKQIGALYAVGIEYDSALAAEAISRADKVIVSDLDNFDIETLGDTKFDLIVFADVLEHTKEPYIVLKKVLKLASGNAQIVISLPNVQHWTVIKNLFIGQWPQRERGLFDKTHLRFFTLRSIQELAVASGLEIEEIHRKYRITDSPSKINLFSKLFALGPLKPFLVYQYIVRLRRINP